MGQWRSRLTRATFIILLFILLHAPLSPVGLKAQQARSAETDRLAQELIRQIEARYGRMRGLAADFEQVYRASNGRERRERGRLFLQRPRRMRWEYDPKPGKLFIVNGREVWFYVPADREATHTETNSVADARFPFLFLLGQANLHREFRSITIADQSGSPEGAHTLRLIPAANINGLREIYLELFSDGRISKVSFVDEAGAVSEVSLSNVRENFNAPPEAFIFRPPPGITVRRQ